MSKARRISEGILSVIGSQYYQPIADLTERLLEKGYQKPDRVSAGYRESGYAAAILILCAAALESFVQRDRYFHARQKGSSISDLLVVTYLKQVSKYRRHRQLDELFEVRNAVTHNHLWHIDFVNPSCGGRRHKSTTLVPNTHRLKKTPAPKTKLPRTSIVRFNLNPIRLDRSDVQKVLSVTIHVLQFLSMNGHNPVPLVENIVGFKGRRLRFGDLAIEIRRAL